MSPRLAFISLLILLPCLPQTGARADEQILNGIAAVVNSEVITYSEVQDLVGTREKSLAGQYQGQELADKVKDLRMSAVQLLIDNQLIVQEFTKNKYSIPDYVVEEQVQSRIKAQFGGDRAAFIRTLGAQGMTMERFRKMVRDDIIVQAMREKSVKEDTIISPEKIQEYYEKNHDQYSTPEQVHLRMIVIKKSSSTGKQMAEELRLKAVGGADFDKLAQMYSEDSTQDTGGDWGWIDKHALNESLTKVAFSLKPGEVSNVIELAGNYYLLYVEAKKPEVTKSLTAVHDDIENKLLEERRQQAQQKWIAGLRQKAYIWIDGVTNTDGGPAQPEHASADNSPAN
jgi:peptidyl-prolyl cis-trans isomerase SurA